LSTQAFTAYIGKDESKWASYDASALIEKYSGPLLPVLCDQGTADDFLGKDQLLPGKLVAQGQGNDNIRLEMRMQDGYDHSYYFISTFMEDHLDFHAKHLAKAE
jgi:S-formylglutathione hydrolase